MVLPITTPAAVDIIFPIKEPEEGDGALGVLGVLAVLGVLDVLGTGCATGRATGLVVGRTVGCAGRTGGLGAGRDG